MSERCVGGLTAHLFRRHVTSRAHDQTRFGHRMKGRRIGPLEDSGMISLARPKSRIFTRPSLVMNRFSGFRSRCTMPFSCAAASPRATCNCVVDRLAGGKRPAPQALAQGLSFQQFGNHVRRALLVSNVEDGKNVGMIQRRRGACFLREALHAVAVSRKRCWQNLDGNGAVQPRIVGAIHFAHSARADQGLDLVRPQLCSGRECHEWAEL